MNRLLSYLKTKNMQKLYIVIGILSMFAIIFAVKPFATDGYENIEDRKTLEKRVATAIANQQTELLIDYSGDNFYNMKSWFKEDFKYDKLINYIDEFSIYNYNGAKYTYWSYGDKKRVKITISYKLNQDQINAVNSFVDSYIDSNGLKKMSQYDVIKNIHDYLINNYIYTSNANNLYNMINSGQANCYGYTMLNYVFLNRLGINVRTTYGAMNEAHIWNVVELNGQWYYEDVTWDTVDKGTSYFLVSTKHIQKTHKIYGNFIPNCPNNYVDVLVNTNEDELISPSKNPTISENSKIEDNITITKETPFIEDETKNVINNTEEYTKKEVENITNNNSENISSNIENKPIVEEPTPTDKVYTNDNDNDTNNNTTTNDNTSIKNTNKETKLQKLIKLLKYLKQLKFTKKTN